MHRKLLWGGVLFLAAGVALAAPSSAQGLPEMETPIAKETIQTRWNKAIEYFTARDYTKSRDLLQGIVNDLRAMGEEEARKVASLLLDQAGEKVVLQMLEQPKLGREPHIIWRLYRDWHIQTIRDSNEIRELARRVVTPSTAEDVRWLCLQKLQTYVGQYAVPALAGYLERTWDDGYRTQAVAALIELGENAALPVIALLDHPDDKVREQACFILGRLEPPEARATAPLKRLWDDPNQPEVVRQNARRALERITGLPIEQQKSAQEYYFEKAHRYYLEPPSVPIEAERADGVIWSLDPTGKLREKQVPLFVWNELMAEDACYRALEIDRSYERILPLLATVYAAEYSEARTFRDILIEGTPLAAEERQQILEQNRRIDETAVYMRLMGPRFLYRAVAQGLIDSRTGREHVARVCQVLISAIPSVDPHGFGLYPPGSFEFLSGGPLVGAAPPPPPEEVSFGRPAPGATPRPRGPGVSLSMMTPSERADWLATVGGSPEGEGRALLDALDHPNKIIRYEAAIALAKMNPPAPFRGSDEVVRILAEGIGESGPPQVLLVLEDRPLAITLRDQWSSTFGWQVEVAHSAREALVKARNYPPKDLLIVSADLREGGMNTTQMFQEMLRDQYLRPYLDGTKAQKSIVILTEKKLQPQARARLGGEYVYLNHDEDDLRLIQEPAEKVIYWTIRNPRALVNRLHAFEISVACADGLLAIEPTRTVFRTTDCVGPCQAGLTHRREEIRLKCVQIFGKFRISEARDRMKDIFMDVSNSQTLRLEALKSLGLIDPKESLDFFEQVYRDHQADMEFVFRYLDSINIGWGEHACESLAPIILFIRQQRLGAGPP